MIESRTGNALSSSSAEAADLYNEAVDLVLGSQSGAAQALDRALELDPRFAMAAAARYFVAKDGGDGEPGPYKRLALEMAPSASAWEREHIETLLGLIDAGADTRDRARDYIDGNPADLLVVSQLAGHLFFYGGPEKLNAVLGLLESVGPALAGDWAWLARLGFATSEAGDRRYGRELIEQALQLRPQSLYSIHALAHLLHDEGASGESARTLERWLAEFGAGACEGQMYGHVQWHLALSEWQTGQREAAWKRYEEYCAPGTTTCGPVLTLADCGGFLLRDYLASGETRSLTPATRKHIDSFRGLLSHPFIALHVAGSYASAGDRSGLERCREMVFSAPPGTNRDIALTLVNALIDFEAGDHSGCAEKLATLSPATRVGIGGSNVERILVDLIEQRVLG